MQEGKEKDEKEKGRKGEGIEEKEKGRKGRWEGRRALLSEHSASFSAASYDEWTRKRIRHI